MSVYVKHSDGSMTPARRGSSPLLGLRHGDQYVSIADEAIERLERAAPTLEKVIMDWEYGSWPSRSSTPAPYLRDLARRIRNAFPEAGL